MISLTIKKFLIGKLFSISRDLKTVICNYKEIVLEFQYTRFDYLQNFKSNISLL